MVPYWQSSLKTSVQHTIVAPSQRTMVSYAEVANPNATMHPAASVVTAMTQHTSPTTIPAGSTPTNLIRKILSSNQGPVSPIPEAPTTSDDDLVTIDGRFYRRISIASVNSKLSNHTSTHIFSSLMDGGTNSGMAGSDVGILSESTFHKANIAGIGENVIKNLSLVSAAGLVPTHHGPAIVILNQYASYGKGHTIQSSGQLRSFGTLVHEAPRSNNGLQCIVTPDGYHIPLCYRSGLPYMDLCPPTDEEFDTLPHIILTSDDTWNPTSLDEFSIDDLILDAPDNFGDQDPRVNHVGEYRS